MSEDRGQQHSASADGWVGSAFDSEIIMNDVEQPKHLLVYDLGLGDTDQAFHSPLMTIANMRAIKNLRVRSQAAESRRRGRWQEKNAEYMQARQDRQEVRQERQDRVPPLRRDNFRYAESPHPNRNRSMSRNTGRDQSTPRRPRTPSRPPRSPTPNRASAPARGSGERRGTTPPWREERGRQRSETPQGRRTRSRIREGHARGAYWTNSGRQQYREPPRCQEPARSSGAAWLKTGAWQHYEQPPENRHHGQGYYQQPYYRYNPRRTSVEYVQGYQVPYEGWIRNAVGTWLDLVPSIFFHQPTWKRRQSELYLYRYTFRVGF